MEAETRLVFKVYLGENEDVRKVYMRREDFSYDNFLAKIGGGAKENNETVTLQYRDPEGDFVTVSSTEDMENAFKDLEVQPFKFRVKVKRKAELNVQVGEEIHSGAVCSCCHEEIRGFRYKCFVCFNYDLCQRCEAKGIHPAHDMMRIASPHKMYPQHFFSRFQRLYEKLHHCGSGSIPLSVSASCRSSVHEPMARDLIEEDAALSSADEAVDADSFKSAQAAEIEEDRADSSLPSIEELTKNVQNLIAKDEEELELSSKGKSDCQVEKGTNALENSPPDMVTSLGSDTKVNDEKRAKEEDTLMIKQPGIDSLLEEKKLATTTNNGVNEQVAKESQNSRQQTTTLSRLQMEIDSLLAPLTPKSSALTPKEEENHQDQEELEEVKERHDSDDESEVSEASSSPFELCEVLETAIIEKNPCNDGEEQTKERKEPETLPEEIPKQQQPKFKIGQRVEEEEEESGIQVISTEICQGPSVESQGALIQIEEKEKKVDEYMMNTSRILSRNQMRPVVVVDKTVTDISTFVSPRSRTMNYSSDTYDYRPPYLPQYESTGSSRMYSGSSSRLSYYDQPSNSSKISEALGQMISMGFTDEDGWLTQLCTMKRGNIEQILDVLTPVKR